MAFHRYYSTMKPRQFLHQCKPDSGTLLRARPAALDTMETFEDPRQFRFRNSHAGVRDGQLSLTVPCVEGNSNLALERKLQRVRQQVQHDLLPHFAIHENRLWEWRAIHYKAKAGPFDGRPKHAGKIAGQRCQIGRLVSSLDAAGLDAGKIQKRIDKFEQSEAIAVRNREITATPVNRKWRSAKHIREWTQHESQGRAELVTYVAEKGRLDAIQLRQSFGAFALLFVGPCFGDGSRDLPRNEFEEGPIIRVEALARVYASNEKPGWKRLTGNHERQDDSGCRGNGPGACRQGTDFAFQVGSLGSAAQT